MTAKSDCTYSLSFRARRLRALADACRLAVMDMLLEGSKTVSEMLEKIDIEQSLLSYHLKILRQESLIESVREGKSVRYKLPDSVALQGPGRGINLDCCRLEMNFYDGQRISDWGKSSFLSKKPLTTMKEDSDG